MLDCPFFLSHPVFIRLTSDKTLHYLFAERLKSKNILLQQSKNLGTNTLPTAILTSDHKFETF